MIERGRVPCYACIIPKKYGILPLTYTLPLHQSRAFGYKQQEILTNDIKELAQHHHEQQQNITDLQLEDLPDVQPNLINKLKRAGLASILDISVSIPSSLTQVT